MAKFKVRASSRRKSCMMKSIILSIVLGGICVFFSFMSSLSAWWHLGQGQVISIHRETFWEMHQGVYFQVTKNFFTIMNDGCYIFWELPGDPHQYDIIRTQDNSVVGILDYEFTNPLLIMYDLETTKSWPCDVTNDEREILFQRLQQEYIYLNRPAYWD